MSRFLWFSVYNAIGPTNNISVYLIFDQLYSPEGRKTEEKNTHINLTN